ncbi:LysE family translocator, partial [Roseovarius amoyensis]|uniref:LysE family translocator n=1 Tax=Roseovarius amoyensis TaxID=2211448 RepID=UPI001EF95FBA
NHTTCHNNDPTKSTASRYKTPCFVDLRQTKSGKISRELSKLGGLGLATVIATSADALSVVKWAGTLYLLWIGLRTLRRSMKPISHSASRRASLRTLWLQGFVTSAANPKAVVFFAALFPQFIDPALPFWPQFLVLSATYIAMDGAFLTGYGAGAHWFSQRLKGEARRWLDRIGGSCIILAAVLLGMKNAASR